MRLLKNNLIADWNIEVDIVPQEFADPIILYNAKKDIKYATK